MPQPVKSRSTHLRHGHPVGGRLRASGGYVSYAGQYTGRWPPLARPGNNSVHVSCCVLPGSISARITPRLTLSFIELRRLVADYRSILLELTPQIVPLPPEWHSMFSRTQVRGSTLFFCSSRRWCAYRLWCCALSRRVSRLGSWASKTSSLPLRSLSFLCGPAWG